MADDETPDKPPPETRLHAGRGILVTQALRLAVRVATAAGLARLVSPADYGVFGMAALLHGLAYMVQDFGLTGVTLRKPTITDDERTALFWLNAGISAGVALIVAAAGPMAAVYFHEPLLRWLLPALAVTFLLNGVHAQLRAQLGREQRFAELNRIEVAAFMVSSAAAMLAAWRGAGSWALAILPISAEIIITIAVWHTQRWRPSRWPVGFSVRSALRFGAGISGHEVLRYLQRNVDQAFIGRSFGSSVLGIYGRSVQLITLPIQYAIDPLAAWIITSLAQSSAETARMFWRRVLNGLAHLTLPVAVILFVVPHDVLRIAFGPNWTDGGDMLRGLALVLVAQPMLAAVTWLLIAMGRTRRLVLWAAVTLSLVVIGCLLTASRSPVALAYAFGAAVFVGAIIGGVFTLHGLPARSADFFAAMIRPLGIAAVAAGTSVLLLGRLPELNTVSRIAIGAVTTLGLWAAACIEPGVRAELRHHFLRERR
jgi:O-antigen/teichoic acid export membrane protein